MPSKSGDERLFVQKLHAVLPGGGRTNAKRDITEAFFGSSRNRTPPNLLASATLAIDALKVGNQKAKIANNPEYKSFIKKIKKLRDSLREVVNYSRDKSIQVFFKQVASQEEELSLDEFKQFFRYAQHIGFTLDLIFEKRTPVGRPSLKPLYEFVYDVAKVYESASGKIFTVFSFSHEAITPGQQFVTVAMDWLNDFARDSMDCNSKYTKVNIYNACDNARTRLSKERRSDK